MHSSPRRLFRTPFKDLTQAQRECGGSVKRLREERSHYGDDDTGGAAAVNRSSSPTPPEAAAIPEAESEQRTLPLPDVSKKCARIVVRRALMTAKELQLVDATLQWLLVAQNAVQHLSTVKRVPLETVLSGIGLDPERILFSPQDGDFSHADAT